MSEKEDLDALERRLAAADFSTDSRIRESLRARLLKKAPSRLPAPSRALRVAVFAACLIAVLSPALWRALRNSEEDSSTHAYPRGAEGLPVLPGSFAPSASPDGAAPVFEVARGREIILKDGKAVEWQLEGASYRLETRRIAPEDLFEKPRI
jgi:hypothetical protein